MGVANHPNKTVEAAQPLRPLHMLIGDSFVHPHDC